MSVIGLLTPLQQPSRTSDHPHLDGQRIFSSPLLRSQSRLLGQHRDMLPAMCSIVALLLSRQMQTLPQDVVERVGRFLTRLELHLGVTDWAPSGLAMLWPAASWGQFDRDIAAQITA